MSCRKQRQTILSTSESAIRGSRSELLDARRSKNSERFQQFHFGTPSSSFTPILEQTGLQSASSPKQLRLRGQSVDRTPKSHRCFPAKFIDLLTPPVCFITACLFRPPPSWASYSSGSFVIFVQLLLPVLVRHLLLKLPQSQFYH